MLKSILSLLMLGILMVGCSDGGSEATVDPAAAGKQAMEKAKALEQQMQNNVEQRLQDVDRQ